jgi:uncharacterized secreted protein with C-terminal beta-propeller domain
MKVGHVAIILVAIVVISLFAIKTIKLRPPITPPPSTTKEEYETVAFTVVEEEMEGAVSSMAAEDIENALLE